MILIIYLGTLKALPSTWQNMPESENLKEQTLKPTDQEYKDVEANFRQTLDGFKVSTIKEVVLFIALVFTKQFKNILRTRYK